MNDYIKEVCQLAGINNKITPSITKGGKLVTTNCEKWQKVTTHTARRTFATNNYNNGIQANVIMAITGHKTEKSFFKYIRTSNQENADIIKASWDKKEK